MEFLDFFQENYVYDVKYALRVCIQEGKKEACVFIYSLLGLYEEAVKESRKWEKRSKENLAQLNGLKESQGKPDPTIEERIAALEKENGDLKAASARAALVNSVAEAVG